MEHCWHNSAFYFHMQTKKEKSYNIWYFMSYAHCLYTERWQAYLQKWFLNACGYFWFIAWWHVKKSRKKVFFLICLFKKLNPLYHERRSVLSWNSNEPLFSLLHKRAFSQVNKRNAMKKIICHFWRKYKSCLRNFKDSKTWTNKVIIHSWKKLCWVN